MNKKIIITSCVLTIVAILLGIGNIILDNNYKKLTLKDKTSNLDSNENIHSEEKKEEGSKDDSIDSSNNNEIDNTSNSVSNNSKTSNKSNITIKPNTTSNKSNATKSNVTSNKSNVTKSNVTSNKPKDTTKANVTSNESNTNKYTVKKETSTKTENYKYGIKIIHTYNNTYYVYPDGTKKLQSSVEDKNKLKYDRSGYNASANDLVPEAKEIMKSNADKINEVIKNVNEYRKKAGVPALVYDENLTLLGTVKALDMYYGNYFSHNGRNGETWGYLDKKLGIKTYAENIALGYSSKNVVAGWYSSDGHRENMLNASFTKIGVGWKNGYWAQEFR